MQLPGQLHPVLDREVLLSLERGLEGLELVVGEGGPGLPLLLGVGGAGGGRGRIPAEVVVSCKIKIFKFILLTSISRGGLDFNIPYRSKGA